MLIGDIVLIAFLSMRAYQDGMFFILNETPLCLSTCKCRTRQTNTANNTWHLVEFLDHYEVPIFGRLANSFVDDE